MIIGSQGSHCFHRRYLSSWVSTRMIFTMAAKIAMTSQVLTNIVFQGARYLHPVRLSPSIIPHTGVTNIAETRANPSIAPATPPIARLMFVYQGSSNTAITPNRKEHINATVVLWYITSPQFEGLQFRRICADRPPRRRRT